MGENVGGVSERKNTVYCSFAEPGMGALKNCLLRPHICALHVVLLTCPVYHVLFSVVQHVCWGSDSSHKHQNYLRECHNMPLSASYESLEADPHR